MKRRTATLVMESRGLAPSVRTTGFHSGWSKLYQSGDCFFDLNFRYLRDVSLLEGQVIGPGGSHPGGVVTITREGAETRLPLDEVGHFTIEVAQGAVDLSFELADVVVEIDDLLLY